MNWRKLYLEYLQNSRPSLYRELLKSGELEQHLDDRARDAEEMYQNIVQQAPKEPPPDWKGTKEQWLGVVKNAAREVVLEDLILVRSEDEEMKQLEQEDLNGGDYYLGITI